MFLTHVVYFICRLQGSRQHSDVSLLSVGHTGLRLVTQHNNELRVLQHIKFVNIFIAQL